VNIRLLGKNYKLVRKRLENHDGHCDSPTTPNKQIIIDSRLKGERELVVYLHELLHGCDWRADESIIEQQSEDMGRALWRSGYRRTV